jgi:hypothetical protein
LVASTLMKGAFARRARRRAISVLPTPVGPIMRMFLGVISVRSGSATCARRQRLRSAIADRALGLALADDVLVELVHDLLRRHHRRRFVSDRRGRLGRSGMGLGHQSVSITWFWLV